MIITYWPAAPTLFVAHLSNKTAMDFYREYKDQVPFNIENAWRNIGMYIFSSPERAICHVAEEKDISMIPHLLDELSCAIKLGIARGF